MSWFDATGFANLAKSALKEAQKTIDKALDIKDEDADSDKHKVVNTQSETSDFFTTWGLNSEEHIKSQEKTSTHKQQNANSIWGSFTGSFFESPKFGEKDTSKTVRQAKSLQSTPIDKNENVNQLVSSISLPENLGTQMQEVLSTITSETDIRSTEEDLNTPNQSYKATSETIQCDTTNLSDSVSLQAFYKNSSSEIFVDTNSVVNKTQEIDELKGIDTAKNDSEILKSTCHADNDENWNETNTIQQSCNANRLSIISSENDKKSAESIEVLESQSNTDCSTTPESDRNSISNSMSSSTMGPKVNSESVEILPDSLVTSPSSVEILGDWKSDSSPYASPIDSKQSDLSCGLERNESITPCGQNDIVMQTKCNEAEYDVSSPDISPYESPIEDMKTLHTNSSSSSIQSTPSPGMCRSLNVHKSFGNTNTSKISPESVEVIPDVDEVDEISLAEDSYTSASESTVMTIMETLQQFDQSKPKTEFVDADCRMHGSCPDDRQMVMKSESQLNLSLDSLKEKHNLHLPLQPITTQPIRKCEHLESANKKTEGDFVQLLNAAVTPSESESVPQVEKPATKPAESMDQYLMLTDSSCEGTLIESSSEDNAANVCTMESKTSGAPLTTSSYVKTMLADAMVEKGEIADLESHCVDVPRESSPISSESRSDLVKIGSDQTSGHTSGDELETTTSSDIEIISSPNGDSSSTQSRQSPAKLQLTKGCDLLTKTLKTRGHSRELSEISIASDDTNLEIEKLLKRIQEVTDILEARESKLIDVSRMNMELHEQNNNLKKQLDSYEKHVEQNQNLNQITDEYTQRLSALERKFQQAIRERDSLRKSLEQLKQEATTRLSSQEMISMNAEKDEIIKELREEGEKLSKQQLQHSNIIKKLRTKEKESDITIKHLKEQIEVQNSELERLKRSLYAKEEVERTQIEAVHTLTAKTKKQEKEILALQEQLDNALNKMEGYKKSLDVAKIDLADTKRNLLVAEEELKHAVDNASESCQLMAQVENLKQKLRQAEESHVKREEFLKHENAELLKRLETAEARSEELSESVSVATKPLLRQLEQLQVNLSHKSNSFMKQEKVLSEKNIELQTKLENLVEKGRTLKEENVNLKLKLSTLESKLSSKETEVTKLKELNEELKVQNEQLAEESKQRQQMLKSLESSYAEQVKDLKRELNSLETKLAVEKAATDAEKRKINAMLEQQQSTEEDLERVSPTLSIGRESVSSVNSVWQALSDSVFDNASGKFPIAYEGMISGASSASTIERLQAQLKQRDGELQQLHWELSRRNVERDALNSEISTLTLKVEELNNQVSQVQALSESLNEIQTRYDALLQMYGEKVEENQELLLDLEDVKEMYKSQIDQLLQRDT